MKLLLVLCVVVGAVCAHKIDEEETIFDDDEAKVEAIPNSHYEEETTLENEEDWYEVHDDHGVNLEYFQTFMIAEMADVLMDSQLQEASPDAVQDDKPTAEGRFFCKRCFKKFKVCKGICKRLVKLNSQITDIIPCGTTCLQRLSACCFAKNNFDMFSFSQGQEPNSYGSSQPSNVQGGYNYGSKIDSIIENTGSKYEHAPGSSKPSSGLNEKLGLEGFNKPGSSDLKEKLGLGSLKKERPAGYKSGHQSPITHTHVIIKTTTVTVSPSYSRTSLPTTTETVSPSYSRTSLQTPAIFSSSIAHEM